MVGEEEAELRILGLRWGFVDARKRESFESH